jgi:hypothetical protein
MNKLVKLQLASICVNYIQLFKRLLISSVGLLAKFLVFCYITVCTDPSTGPGSVVGNATDHGLDGPGIESRWGKIFRPPWGPPSLLYNGYRVFSGGKVRLGRAVDHSPPSNVAVKKG